MNTFKMLKKTDPEVWDIIAGELQRQQENIILIASENMVSMAGLAAQGSVLTNKYAEGYPGRRWYRGCENADRVEALAIKRAKELYGAEHANVQPHAGTQANHVVYNAVLEPGDVILAMDLNHGGHLSHGHHKNYTGRAYKAVFYGVRKDTETIDYDQMEKLARQVKPRLIIAGASSYPRHIDFERFGNVAREVSAYFMADIAHTAGLVAAGLHASPIDHADFVTGTTHKTLRGARGGFVLCRNEYAKKIDEEVFPGFQGGPLMHAVAAKAVAFKEALTDEFKQYQTQVVENANVLAEQMKSRGYRLVSDGTDTHLFLIDLSNRNLSGHEAALALSSAGLVLNKNVIPFDKRSPHDPSGIRIGTPTVTSRGMGTDEMVEIAECMDTVLSGKPGAEDAVRSRITALCARFPLYEGLREDIGAAGTA